MHQAFIWGESAFLHLQERMVVSVPGASLFRRHSAFDWITLSLTVLLFLFKRKRKHEPPTLINKGHSSLVNDIALWIWLVLLPSVFSVLLKNVASVRNSHKHTVGLITPKYTFCSKCETSQICTCHINYVSKIFSKGWEWRAHIRTRFVKAAYLILSFIKVE